MDSECLQALNKTEVHAFSSEKTQISRSVQCRGCLQNYSAEEIRKTTNGYATCLGGGGYGNVYKGSLSHIPVAVKVLGADVMQVKSQRLGVSFIKLRLR